MENTNSSIFVNTSNASLQELLNPTNWSLMHQGGLVVVLDMTITVFSVIANLVVITSIREKEEMLAVEVSLLLANLCASNLLSAILSKSIGIVHNGHAVASNSLRSSLAFCPIYSFSWRLTWAVLPWTIVLLSWLSVLPRIHRLRVSSSRVSSKSIAVIVGSGDDPENTKTSYNPIFVG